MAGIPDSGSMCSRLFRATPQQDDPTGEQFEKKPTSTKAAGTLGAHRPDPPTLRKHRNAHPNPQSGTLTLDLSAHEPSAGTMAVEVHMSDSAQHSHPSGFDGLPRDLTEAELDNAPVLISLEELVIEDLTDEEADAFFAALDA